MFVHSRWSLVCALVLASCQPAGPRTIPQRSSPEAIATALSPIVPAIHDARRDGVVASMDPSGEWAILRLTSSGSMEILRLPGVHWVYGLASASDGDLVFAVEVQLADLGFEFRLQRYDGTGIVDLTSRMRAATGEADPTPVALDYAEDGRILFGTALSACVIAADGDACQPLDEIHLEARVDAIVGSGGFVYVATPHGVYRTASIGGTWETILLGDYSIFAMDGDRVGVVTTDYDASRGDEVRVFGSAGVEERVASNGPYGFVGGHAYAGLWHLSLDFETREVCTDTPSGGECRDVPVWEQVVFSIVTDSFREVAHANYENGVAFSVSSDAVIPLADGSLWFQDIADRVFIIEP